MEDIRKIIDDKFESAANGRIFYIDLKNEHNIGIEDTIILMPSTDNEVNFYTLKHLPQFMAGREGIRVHIVTNQVIVPRLLSALNLTNKVHLIEIADVNMQKILDFCSLYQFTNNLIIASLDQPAGRSIKNLVGKKGVTKEELVSIAILLNRQFLEDGLEFNVNEEELQNILGSTDWRDSVEC